MFGSNRLPTDVVLHLRRSEASKYCLDYDLSYNTLYFGRLRHFVPFLHSFSHGNIIQNQLNGYLSVTLVTSFLVMEVIKE